MTSAGRGLPSSPGSDTVTMSPLLMRDCLLGGDLPGLILGPTGLARGLADAAGLAAALVDKLGATRIRQPQLHRAQSGGAQLGAAAGDPFGPRQGLGHQTSSATCNGDGGLM